MGDRIGGGGDSEDHCQDVRPGAYGSAVGVSDSIAGCHSDNVHIMKWYALIHMDAPSPDEIIMRAKVPSESPWFSGHFPGEPILPGIAQLDMVRDAVARLHQLPFRVSGVKKVRFKRVVKPEELMRITVVPKKGEDMSYVFRITVEGEQVSNGILTVEPL